MENIKLSKAEIAALDLLIATLEEGDNQVKFGSADQLAAITAITRVTRTVTKATPYVTYVVDAATYVIGSAGKADKEFSAFVDKNGKLDLQSLIELRKRVS